jgi:hypothetical protein
MVIVVGSSRHSKRRTRRRSRQTTRRSSSRSASFNARWTTPAMLTPDSCVHAPLSVTNTARFELLTDTSTCASTFGTMSPRHAKKLDTIDLQLVSPAKTPRCIWHANANNSGRPARASHPHVSSLHASTMSRTEPGEIADAHFVALDFRRQRIEAKTFEPRARHSHSAGAALCGEPTLAKQSLPRSFAVRRDAQWRAALARHPSFALRIQKLNGHQPVSMKRRLQRELLDRSNVEWSPRRALAPRANCRMLFAARQLKGNEHRHERPHQQAALCRTITAAHATVELIGKRKSKRGVLDASVHRAKRLADVVESGAIENVRLGVCVERQRAKERAGGGELAVAKCE